MPRSTLPMYEENKIAVARGTAQSNKLVSMGDDMLLLILSSWLDFFDFGVLDVAMSDRGYRQRWLELLSRSTSKVFDESFHCADSLQWMNRRRISMKNIEFLDDKNRIRDNTFVTIQFRTLLSINLLDCCHISNTAISLIANGCHFLECIVLEGCDNIDDIGISFLAQKCTGLISINFSNCKKITSIGMDSIARSCMSLQHIDICDCSRISTIGLENIANKCHEIRSFKFNGIFFEAGLIYAIAESCILLEEISLCGIYPLRGQMTEVTSMIHLATRCKQLRTLDLHSSTYCCDETLLAISKESSLLESLDIGVNSNITFIGISAIGSGCKNLTTINLSKCSSVTDMCLYILALSCIKLVEINLSGCEGITNDGVGECVKICPQLRVIDISLCYYITEYSVRDMAKSCTQLTHVNLTRCFLAPGTIANFGIHCQNLTSIKVSESCSVFDSDVQVLANGCRQLREIVFKQCIYLTNLSLISIAEFCANLLLIHLDDCNLVTDEGVISLSLGCQKLNDINLNNCYRITDASIRALKNNCLFLRKLNVEQCPCVNGLAPDTFPLISALYSRAVRTCPRNT